MKLLVILLYEYQGIIFCILPTDHICFLYLMWYEVVMFFTVWYCIQKADLQIGFLRTQHSSTQTIFCDLFNMSVNKFVIRVIVCSSTSTEKHYSQFNGTKNQCITGTRQICGVEKETLCPGSSFLLLGKFCLGIVHLSRSAQGCFFLIHLLV